MIKSNLYFTIFGKSLAEVSPGIGLGFVLIWHAWSGCIGGWCAVQASASGLCECVVVVVVWAWEGVMASLNMDNF